MVSDDEQMINRMEELETFLTQSENDLRNYRPKSDETVITFVPTYDNPEMFQFVKENQHIPERKVKP